MVQRWVHGVTVVQYSTIRYDTIRYDTIRYDTIRYDTIRYDTIRGAVKSYGDSSYCGTSFDPVVSLVVRHVLIHKYLYLVIGRSEGPPASWTQSNPLDSPT